MRAYPASLSRATLVAGLLAAMVAAEWLRAPWPGWVIGAGLLGLGGLAAVARLPVRSRALALALPILALLLLFAGRSLTRLEREWPAEREARVSAAYRRLSGELRAAYERTEQAAERAVPLAGGDRAVAFTTLDRDLPRDGAEVAVAILEPTGVPWAWAGRHRLAPQAEGPPIAARLTRFYGTIESRRVSPSGRVVVASTLVWADSSVPRPDRSLAARFGASAGVQLRLFAPGTAPMATDLFDYSVPTTAGEQLLFSLQPVPPDQVTAQRESWNATARLIGWATLLVLCCVLLAAGRASERLGLLAVMVWCTLRAPLGAALGLEDLFSPATFFRGVLRPVSGSAGHLLVAGTALLLFALWLWDRRLARRPAGVLLAGLLLLGAPYLVAELGRGITPPVGGVTTTLWVSWQATLTIATTALILLAAALLRGAGEPVPRPGGLVVAMSIAVAAAIIGLSVWEPRGGWPDWYTFLWTPALVLVALPRGRWAAIIGAAMVAGTAATLVTWGAEQAGRVTAAQRDLARLGDAEDPLATPLLQRFREQVARAPEPASAAELFLLWRGSDLAGQEYPARLALWNPDGSRLTELALDSLDLPAPLASALVQGLDSATPAQVVSLKRVPGRHYVLLARLPSGRVLSAAVGPRTRLLVPTRLARMLRPPAEGPPLYELTLTPPFTRGLGPPAPERWVRHGPGARTDRLLDLPGGARHVHAVVGFRPMPYLLVRATLLVVGNILAVLLLALLASLRWADLRRRLAPRRLARSFQLRLALALAGFFILPAVGFTLWGLGRLTDEANRTRDLLITSVLRDAVLTAGGLLQEPEENLAEGLGDLSNRLDADLVLYSGGRLVAASTTILRELSLVEPVMEARTFQRLALGDEVELTRQATTYVAPVRVGYRVASAGPPGGVGILATPQLTFDWTRRRDQLDLQYFLLLATLTGMVAAAVGAQLAARALSRPVADLGRSAAAVGRGEALPPIAAPPAEFETVFASFERMAQDIRESQAALDGARRRTAAVLANVATAVVAIDGEGAIILANGRARQLLGADLPEGDGLAAALPSGWAPLLEALARYHGGVPGDADLECLGRTYRVQLAALGATAAEGVVLALDDLTEPTRAARVLAWGEMARQVAHEIKNPLTPIRLGVQHLRRVRKERPAQFDAALEETTTRILAEIDRLDTIARAFSRFGLPGNLSGPLEAVELVATAHEVAALYRLGEDGGTVDVTGVSGATVPARRDEVKEVLGNLVENARGAGARRVRLEVEADGFVVDDDGRGIPAELLPRIFEPRFSTTTSGSGLGLAIVRRLVEGWGASVTVASTPDRGTRVSVRWPTVVAPGRTGEHSLAR
ncbi:MAG: ATP-binding protein [Gemmatimonadales bacterium]